MPAVSRAAAKRSPAPKSAPARGRRKPAAYAPAKLAGAARVGLPPQAALSIAGLVLAGGLCLMMMTGGRAQALHQAIADTLDRRAAALGFQVKQVRIEGASDFSRPYIMSAARQDGHSSILSLDLELVRQKVEQVGWVKDARVVRLLPDTLLIRVAERPRLAVWQHSGKTEVVDVKGQVIPEADPSRFPALPLVVGEGAAEAAGDILPLLAGRSRLSQRLEALVRVDHRRWDLRLKDGTLIQLPAEGEDAALIQLDQLDRQARVLELGLERIDLRDPMATAVRPRANSPAPAGL
jgi:cell division protein FtsQ